MSVLQLPELPSSLKRLVLRSCSSLEKLPNLPLGLTDLVIGECDELTALPALPESLKELSVDHSPIEQVKHLSGFLWIISVVFAVDGVVRHRQMTAGINGQDESSVLVERKVLLTNAIF